MVIEHNAIPNLGIHEPKDINTALINTVYLADGSGGGAWDTPPGPSASTVWVTSLSDLPTPAGDVITLAANTKYCFDGSVNIGVNRFVLNTNSVICGIGNGLSGIVSTTTGALITTTQGFWILDLQFSCANGTLFSCTGGANEVAFINRIDISAAISLGTFTNWNHLFWDQGVIIDAGSGLAFAGACGLLILDLVEFITWDDSAIAVDLGAATFDSLFLIRCGFQALGGTGQTGIDILPNSGNINVTRFGNIISCEFCTPLATAVANSDTGDIQWIYAGNSGLPSTEKSADIYIQGNATGTSATTTPVIMAGSTWVEEASKQFTSTVGGRVTYTGFDTTGFDVHVSLHASATSGSSQTYFFYIAKNGTIQQASRAKREFTTSTPGTIAIFSHVNMSTNDFIEIFLEKATGTDTMTVDDAHVVVSAVSW